MKDGVECDLVYMNSGSTLSKFAEIEAFITDRSPLVVCISETHLTGDIYDCELFINGYVCFREDSVSRYTGGVQMYLRDDIQVFDVVQECLQMNYWLLGAYLNIYNKKYLVVCIYHSPSSSDATFLNCFEAWCDANIDDRSCSVIIVGDFNIDLFTDSTYSRRLGRYAGDIGLNQIITETTRPASGSLIDLVFTRDPEGVKHLVLQTPRISDHCIISLKVGDCCCVGRPVKMVESRGRDINFEEMNERLLEVDWNYRHADLDEKFSDMYSRIMCVLDEVAPKRQIRILPKFKPWWNADVRNAVESRDCSYRMYKREPTQINWDAYKRNRNEAVRVIRVERLRYYEGRIDACKHNSSKMWNTLKELMPGRISGGPLSVEFDDGILKDSDELPDRLNNYFLGSIGEIVDKIDSPQLSMTEVIDLPLCNSFGEFELLDAHSLKDVLYSLSNKSSPDELDMNILKNTFHSIQNPLLHLINSSLETGVVPSQFKISTVIPVPKVTNSRKVSNLRPINMLIAVDKILEKCVYLQLLEFIEKNDIFSERQSGFRKNHSCETAIQGVIDEWKLGVGSGSAVLAVFVDFQRAFETIDRNILLGKLRRIGVVGTVYRWFSDYLSNRQQCVRVNGSVSDRMASMSGVPQGSILGPILFVLYINDITSRLMNVEVHLFADDTMLFTVSRDLSALKEQMTEALDMLYRYTCQNKIKINVKKSKFMLIGTERILRTFALDGLRLSVGGTQIERVKTMKYLGVIVDCRLQFKEHWEYIVSKISRGVNYLSRCAPYLSKWSRLAVFNTIIFPHFTFCSTILYLLNQGEIDRLQKLQNRAMRIILSCSRYTPIRSMLQQLCWLPVKEYLSFSALIFIYKVKSGRSPAYLVSKLTYIDQVHGYGTRQQNDFFVVSRGTKSAENSVFNKGLKMYNALPREVKNCETLGEFKAKLKAQFLSSLYRDGGFISHI